MKLLEELIAIQGVSGDEANIKDFLVKYVEENAKNWTVQPQVIHGEKFQDTLILVFGKPSTAIYAHTDTIGFTIGYENNLIKVGGPRIEEDYQLVGQDSNGLIDAPILAIENEEGDISFQCAADRLIERGTNLSFKPNFRETDTFVQSPYLDNRLGVWSALKVAETLENGAIVFSTYEEHGGNSVAFAARYLYDKYELRQALISDITWVTPHVVHGGGVAISMRDSGVPRRKYLNRIVDLAKKSGIKYQLEVESAGGSDGGVLQRSELLIDWLFIGAPEDHVHTPNEIVAKEDIMHMVEMYKYLMKHL